MTRLIRFAAPLLAVAGSADLASAGWNNVYQVTCWGCKHRAARSDSYYHPPAPSSRSSYFAGYDTRTETVTQTVMRPEKFIEEVPTVERRSYYEPETTYSRSSYYNPVTGCCEVVEKPHTRMVRKEECTTVMKAVERLRMVPTQVQREVEVRRPIYYGPEERIVKSPVCALPGASSGPARVEELRSVPPRVNAEGGTLIPRQDIPTTPGGTSLPRAMPPAKVGARSTSRSSGTVVRGEVVRPDQSTPQAGAKLVLVSAADSGVREYVTADEFGRFDASVPAGTWHLYVGSGNGRAGFYKTLKLADADERNFTLVSR